MLQLGNGRLTVICAATALWAFSFGLGSQSVTHWLRAHGESESVIGLNHSFYYLGLAVASFAVPTLARRFGLLACSVGGLFASGLTLAVFPCVDVVWAGYVLRFANGCAGALSLVPLETIVSRYSPTMHKARNFACYCVALTLGGALGIGSGLGLLEATAAWIFPLGGCTAILAAGAIGAGLKVPFDNSHEAEITSVLDWRANYLSFGTAWCQGFLEGGMLAFLSSFLIGARGFSAETTGLLMGATMVGVILCQVPVSWFADRWGKTPTLLLCYAVVAVGLLAMPLLTDSIALASVLFCFGACSGAMYPLGLALLGERTSEAGLARAYAWYLAIECIGSQLGAAAMGQARDLWGESAMFPVGLVAVVGVLAGWLVIVFTNSASSAAVPVANEDQRRVA